MSKKPITSNASRGSGHAFAAIKFLLAIVASAGLLVTPAPAATNSQPFATGGFQGTLAFGNQNIAFSARTGADGRVVGHLSETLVAGGLSKLRGDVTCLAVSGDRAAIGYLVRESSGVLALSMPEGTTQMFLVQDRDAGDTFAFGGPLECSAAIGVEPIFPITHGNITVRE